MERVLVVYWSGTGNTEIMAEKIAEGLEEEGIDVELLSVDDIDPDDVQNYEKIALGCSSMGDEELEESEFLPFYEDAADYFDGKKVALFGSFGAWGDGKGAWMDKWEASMNEIGAVLFEKGLKIVETPDDEGEEMCIEFGQRFAKF
ncbi:MAG: flavodoxin [Acholeplasmataceae bacterium]